jgi:hypothetical protein
MSALDDLQAVMFKWKEISSVITPTLRRLPNITYKWRLQFIEDFGITDDAGNHYPSRALDKCVDWVEEKLKDWPDCNRKAWDMWDFKYRKDAEKFITVFHLSWAQ